MRKIITSILGLLIVFGAVILAKKLAASKNQPKPVEQKIITPVFTESVKNSSTPITLTTSGNLSAKDKVELFSEVQGIFEKSTHDFKPGSYYSKGQVLLRINSDEHRANLRAQKSSLYNQLVMFMPDLRLDYPDAFPKWQTYIRSFDESKPLWPLPETSSEKEKLFIAGKNVYTTYYNIINVEERLRKYTVSAPFSGVLTEALVNPGALVRNGQKLGEFISTSIYEMEVNVNIDYMDLLKIGKSVKLHNLDRNNNWSGKVIRVNGRVDQASQTIKAYIQVSGKNLKDGMYLEADIVAKEEQNTYEINRKLLFDEHKVFIVTDTILDVAEIVPIYFKEKTVVVKGLADGTQLLSKPVPGAYKGMRVAIFE